MKNYSAIILQIGLGLGGRGGCDNTTFVSRNTGNLINKQINRVMTRRLPDKDISFTEFPHGSCDGQLTKFMEMKLRRGCRIGLGS